ncbi:hypothetical protein C1H46_036751 [Malus baccata]|uniref:DUF4378 domain-containing protein n=1 Tax=Malus baccata TaxID=106549 RepID=A0A540KU60_MALBA|nr:hypothetical protein C1H46_036751 [Malus baccata]
MLEEDDDDDECEEDESETSDSSSEETLDGLLREVLSKLNFPCNKRIPEDVQILAMDLIVEEQRDDDSSDRREEVVRRVCKRFESWKEVESNTIDMMVEQDFRKELDEWKKSQDQVGETAMEIELAIFSLLVEEMAIELV